MRHLKQIDPGWTMASLVQEVGRRDNIMCEHDGQIKYKGKYLYCTGVKHKQIRRACVDIYDLIMIDGYQ